MTSQPIAAPPLWAAVAVIAVGGGVGSLFRYELGRAITPPHNGFPIATLLINLLGSLLLGALVVAVTEVWRTHPLVRPALGTGLLGGFTTFSTFAVEVRGASGGVASSYVIASLIGGVAAAAIGMWLVRAAVRQRGAEPDLIDPDLP